MGNAALDAFIRALSIYDTGNGIHILCVLPGAVETRHRVTLPYKPYIGALSCFPEIDSTDSLTPDNHGGCMDLPDMGQSSITYRPVRSPGARLFIGDAHA